MRFARVLFTLTGVIALNLLSAAPVAADDWDAVPKAVATSLAPGGAAATEATLLLDRSPTAHPDLGGAVMTSGPPLRLLVWGTPESPLRPQRSAGALTEADLSDDVGARWLAVIFVDGEPHTTLEVDRGGDFVALGGCLPADIEVLATIESGAVILGAAVLGAPDELYRVGRDRMVLTPLNAAARAVVGPEPVSVEEFRFIRARLSEIVRASQLDRPADSIGSAADGPETSRTSLVAPLGIAAMAVAVSMLLTRATMARRRHKG